MGFIEIIEKYPNWANYITEKSGRFCFKKYNHSFMLNEQYDYSHIYETYDYIREFLLANDFKETGLSFTRFIYPNLIWVSCVKDRYFYSNMSKYDVFTSDKLIILIKKILNIEDSMNKLVEL